MELVITLNNFVYLVKMSEELLTEKLLHFNKKSFLLIIIQRHLIFHYYKIYINLPLIVWSFEVIINLPLFIFIIFSTLVNDVK